MSEMLSKSLEQLLGYAPERLMIVDPRVGKPTGHEARAQLRSIPMLVDLGMTKFTYSSVWHPDVKFANYEYQIFNEKRIEDINSPICQLVSQEVENHSGMHLTRRLLHQDVTGTFILVVDQDTISLNDAQGGRSIKEDFGFHVVDYDHVFRKYLKKGLGIENPAIGISKTKNAVYHKIATTHREYGLELSGLADLFEYSKAPPESQVWDILLEFANRRQKVLEEFDRYVRQNLRPWTERGEVGDITTSILDKLQQCNFDKNTIEEYRNGEK